MVQKERKAGRESPRKFPANFVHFYPLKKPDFRPVQHAVLSRWSPFGHSSSKMGSPDIEPLYSTSHPSMTSTCSSTKFHLSTLQHRWSHVLGNYLCQRLDSNQLFMRFFGQLCQCFSCWQWPFVVATSGQHDGFPLFGFPEIKSDKDWPQFAVTNHTCSNFLILIALVLLPSSSSFSLAISKLFSLSALSIFSIMSSM